MSEREQIQNEINAFLEQNGNYFNAPYGILDGMESFGKGKVRVITFGVARYLDATVKIYSPTNIQVRGQGALLYKFQGFYRNAKDLINHFKSQITK